MDTPLTVPMRPPTRTSEGKCWSALTRRLPVAPARRPPIEATATCSCHPAEGWDSRLSAAAYEAAVKLRVACPEGIDKKAASSLTSYAELAGRWDSGK